MFDYRTKNINILVLIKIINDENHMEFYEK